MESNAFRIIRSCYHYTFKTTKLIPKLTNIKMRKLVLFFTICFLYVNSASAQPFDKKLVLKQMILANDYFMQKWPETGKTIITNKERPSNIWTRGVYYEGLMALY